MNQANLIPAGNLPVKTGRPKRTDRYALAERDAAVSRMAARGIPYSEIAREMGYRSTGGVANAVKRARQAIRAKGAEELRDAQRAALDALEADAWDDLADPGFKISSTTGAIVKDPRTGEPMQDKAAKDAARNTLLKITRTRIELEGTAAPKRSIVAQFTIEQRQQIEAEILASDRRLSGREPVIYDAEIVEE